MSRQEFTPYKGLLLRLEQDDNVPNPNDCSDQSVLVAWGRQFSVRGTIFYTQNGRGQTTLLATSADVLSEREAYDIFAVEVRNYGNGGSIYLMEQVKLGPGWPAISSEEAEFAYEEARSRLDAAGAALLVPKLSPLEQLAYCTDTKEQASSYIQEWARYLAGDVWDIQVMDADGNEIESLGGVYGEADALVEAQALANAYITRRETREVEVTVLKTDGTWDKTTDKVLLTVSTAAYQQALMGPGGRLHGMAVARVLVEKHTPT